jgi:hypothetical protein
MTTQPKNLIKQFKKSGLKLIIRDNPFRTFGNDRRIFQMDVLRDVKGSRRKEWFEMFLGEGDVNVQIIDTDPDKIQVLLLVQEPERTFEVTERKTHWRKKPDERRMELKKAGEKFHEDKTNFYIQQKTPSDKRHFLMGVDERQLFVARLTRGVSSIVDARRSLGSTVQFHEGTRKMTPNRQGEWFFVKTTKQQEEDIELLLAKNRIWIIKKENIGKYAGRESGNPHTADEIVVIPQSSGLIEQCKQSKFMSAHRPIVQGEYPLRAREVFVRGKVRHIDHKTIKYSHWYQVILNNENQTQATASWID